MLAVNASRPGWLGIASALDGTVGALESGRQDSSKITEQSPGLQRLPLVL